MKYRALTATGDYTFGNNEFDYIEGPEAIAQAIQTKVLLFYGEWWENLGLGIPMFQSILGQMNPEYLKISSSLLITQRILEIPEVTSVEDVEIKIEERTLAFVIRCNTNQGAIESEVRV